MGTQRRTWRTRIALIAAGFVLAVSGCAGAPGSDSAAMPSVGSFESPAIAPDTPASEMEAPAYDEKLVARDATAAAGHGQMYESATVIKSASAYVVVDNPNESLTQLRGRIEDVKGKIDMISANNLSSHSSIQVIAKVPRQDFEAFIESLDDVGTVESLQQNSEEVGPIVTDLEARITTLEGSIQRLRELLSQTQTVSDVLAAEEQITSRQAELDGLVAQRDWYKDQIDMSRIDITLASEAQLDPPSPWGRMWFALTEAFLSMVYTLVWAIPWIALLLVLVGVWKLRKVVRNRKTASGTVTRPAKTHTPNVSHAQGTSAANGGADASETHKPDAPQS